ncbi:MAG: hypothetical protein LCH98_03910 [Actinobacteria bacterium]|nr:hypothetical protein [Actinomycetota bacterium]
MGSHVAGIRFAGGSYGRAFQIHPLGAHEFAMQHLVDAGATKRLLVGRREVKVTSAADRSSTTATLLGAHHELMTVFTGPAPDERRISDLFGVLDIDDAPEGMAVRPQSETMLTPMGEHIVLIAEDFTSVDVPGPTNASEMVPKGRGRKTRNGEVWRNRLPGRAGTRANDFSYVVGTPRGAAEVIASDENLVSEENLLAMVDSLDVAWSAGKGRR